MTLILTLRLKRVFIVSLNSGLWTLDSQVNCRKVKMFAKYKIYVILVRRVRFWQ